MHAKTHCNVLQNSNPFTSPFQKKFKKNTMLRREDCIWLHVTVVSSPLVLYAQGPLHPFAAVRLAEGVRSFLGVKTDQVNVVLRHTPTPHWKISFPGEALYHGEEGCTQLLATVIETLKDKTTGKWRLSDDAPPAALRKDLPADHKQLAVLKEPSSPSSPAAEALPAADREAHRSEDSFEVAVLTSLGVLEETSFFKRLNFKRHIEILPKISACSEIPSVSTLKRISVKGRSLQDEAKQLQQMLRGIEAGQLHVNATDADGRTALHYACSTAQYTGGERAKENIVFLLEMGGNPMICDVRGVRAVDLAERLSITDDTNTALSVLLKFSSAAKAKILETELPHPIAELQHEGVSVLAFSEVVPTILYYSSVTTGALCCRYLVSKKSSVLHVPSSTVPGGHARARGFLVLPYSDALHSGSVSDFLLLDDGTVLVVDHKAVDPVVKSYTTPVSFDRAPHGAPLAAMMWADSTGSQRAIEGGIEGRSCRLRPSYLVSMKKEIDLLESTSVPISQTAVESETSFARHMLLFPYAQMSQKEAKENGAELKAATQAHDSNDDDSCDWDDESDAPASRADADADVATKASWIGVLALVTKGGDGPHLVTLHLPWFSTDTTRDIGQSLCDSVKTAWLEVPSVRRREAAEGADVIATEHFLERRRRVGFVTSHAKLGVVAFGMDLGHYILYDCSTMDFSTHSQTPSGGEEADATMPLPYTVDPPPPLSEPSDQQLPPGHPDLLVPRLPLPPPFEAPATNSICIVASFNEAGHLALCSSHVAVYDVQREGGHNAPLAKPAQHFLLGSGDEVCTGCFHPRDPETLIFTRSGLLVYFSVKTRQTGVLGVLKLTDYELSRKEEDDDLFGTDADYTISGTHKLCFSPDGSLLYRLNTLHKCAAVYEWKGFAALLAKERSAVYVQKTLLDVRGVNMNWNWVSQRILKSHLSTERSLNVSTDDLKAHLASFCSAIQQGRIWPCYRDRDGRTALHVALDLANSTDFVVSAQAKAMAVWLLKCGASLHSCDHSNAHTRPYDLAAGFAALDTPPCAQPLTTTNQNGAKITVAADAVLQFRSGCDDEVEMKPVAAMSPSAQVVNFNCREKCNIPPIAELGEDCEQVLCSSSFEGILYFLSLARGAVLALNLEKQFSAEIFSFPGATRMTVFPYTDVLHEEKDKDYILLSNGTLLRVHFLNGPSVHPIVTATDTYFRSDLQGGVQGLYLATSHVRINPDQPDAADYSMGTVSTVCVNVETGRREHVCLHLSSLLYPHDKEVKSCLDFLRDAINMAWCSEGVYRIINVLHQDVVASHVSAANRTTDPGGFVLLFYESPQTNVEIPGEPGTHSVIGYIMEEHGHKTYLVAPRSDREGITVGASISFADASRKQVVAMRFSRSLEMYTIEKGDSIAYPQVEVSGCDTVAENVHGSFHPSEPQLFVFCREGSLCLLNTCKEEFRCVSEMRLSIMESRRKETEGDGVADQRITGHQLISLSATGVYVVRYNAFYRSFVVYSWADITKRMRSLGTNANLTPLPPSIDPSVIPNRPPRKMELKGSLKRMTTKGLSLREKRAALGTFIEAIGAGLVPPNFSDTEGKTAMHVLFDIAHQISVEEAVKQAVWLLTKGINVFATDTDLVRPIDALRSGSGREVLLKAIAEFQKKHCPQVGQEGVEVRPGKPRPTPFSPPLLKDVQSHTPDLIVFSIAASSTAPSVIFALCSQNSHRKVFETGKSQALWCIIMIDTMTQKTAVVSQGDGDAEGVSYYVFPYGARLHGGSNIDFILLGDKLVTVRRLPQCVVDTTPLGGVLEVSRDCSLSCLWTPPAEDTTPCTDYADMTGAICYLHQGSKSLRTLRLPAVDHDDGNKTKFLVLLLKLASPTETPLPEVFINESRLNNDTAHGSLENIKVKSVWHGSAGSFLVYNGQTVLAVSHRGVVRKIICNVEPTPCRFDLTVGGYDEGAHIAVHRPAGVDFYTVACTDEGLAMCSQCRCHDHHSDSLDMTTFAFHPTEPLAVGIIDNELIVYDCISRTITSSHLVTMSDLEVAQRKLDGDGTADTLIGPQRLLFSGSPSSAEGAVLCRVNAFYQTVTCYPQEALLGQYRGALHSNVVSCFNALHLESLCSIEKKTENIRIASPIQPGRRGNIERKENTGGALGRTRNYGRSAECQKATLSKFVRLMSQGSVGPNFADADGYTALHLLCSVASSLAEEELAALIKYVLSIGGSLFSCDKRGNRPFDLLKHGELATEIVLTTMLAYHLSGVEAAANFPPLPQAAVECEVHGVQMLPSRTNDNICYATCNERGSTRTTIARLYCDLGAKVDLSPAPQGETFEVDFWRNRHKQISEANTPAVHLHAENDFTLTVTTITTHAAYLSGNTDVLLTSQGTLLHIKSDVQDFPPETQTNGVFSETKRTVPEGYVTELSIPCLKFKDTASGYIGAAKATFSVVSEDMVLCIYVIPTDKLCKEGFYENCTQRMAFDLLVASLQNVSFCSSCGSAENVLKERAIYFEKNRHENEVVRRRSSFKKRLSETIEHASEIDETILSNIPDKSTKEPISETHNCRAVAATMALKGEVLCVHLSNCKTVLWKARNPSSVLYIENTNLSGEVIGQTVIRSPQNNSLLQILVGASLMVYDLSFMEEGDPTLLHKNSSLTATPVFYLCDREDGEDTMPMAGVLNPTNRAQYIFIKDGMVCTLDLNEYIVCTIGELRRGKVEDASAKALQLDPMNLLQLSSKCSKLITINEFQGIVAFQEWSAMVALIEQQAAEPTVVNNAIYLPPVIAGVDLSVVYSQLIGAGVGQGGGGGGPILDVPRLS